MNPRVQDLPLAQQHVHGPTREFMPPADLGSAASPVLAPVLVPKIPEALTPDPSTVRGGTRRNHGLWAEARGCVSLHRKGATLPLIFLSPTQPQDFVGLGKPGGRGECLVPIPDSPWAQGCQAAVLPEAAAPDSLKLGAGGCLHIFIETCNVAPWSY